MSEVSRSGKPSPAWLLPTKVACAYLLLACALSMASHTLAELTHHHVVIPLGAVLVLLSAGGLYGLVARLDGARRRALAAGELTRQQHRTILDAAHDVFLIVNHANRIIDCNASAPRHYQYTRNELIGMRYDDLLSRANDQQANAGFSAAAYETRTQAEEIHRRKDGTTFPVELSLCPCTLDEELVCVYVIRNTEKRKNFENALTEQRYLFDMLMDHIPDKIYFKDLEGRFTRVSQALGRHLGGTEATDVIGKTDFDFFTEQHARNARKVEERIIATGEPVVGLLEEETWPDRESNWVSTTKLPFPDRAGRLVGTFGISRDVSDLKRAEDELRQLADSLARSNTELQQFAYVASHDLQEPLRMVASYVQLLARRYRGKLDADADEFIAYAVDGANRMKTLINDLLTYSRVGTQAKPFEPTDCNALLRGTLDNLQLAIEEAGAVITADPLPVVMADAAQLPQVFQNLVGNALKFHRAEETPTVHITVQQEEGHWRFAIRDNGIGIDPQYAERIFVIFQRLHTREEYAGTGIGLSVCKKIVERHGGSIWFESMLGQGTTFYFTLSIAGGHVDVHRHPQQSCENTDG